jgi:hypothetical protein
MCPECGFEHRRRPLLESRDNLLYAPIGYLRMLQAGALLMAAGVLGMAALTVARIIGGAPEMALVGARLAIGTMWLAGVWIVTSPRKVSERTAANPKQEWRVSRWVNRGTQACWLLSAIVGVLVLQAGPKFSWSSMTPLEALELLLATGAMIGLVPLAIQLADLAEWGADSSLASRLRGAAWGLLVFGVIVYAGSLLGRFSMRCSRKSFASANSVSLFPRPRIRDITFDRFALVKTSAICF